jgi:hypothetical protein
LTFLIGALCAALGLAVTVVVLRAPANDVLHAQVGQREEFDMSELDVFAGEF